jgi:hypothetical protein
VFLVAIHTSGQDCLQPVAQKHGPRGLLLLQFVNILDKIEARLLYSARSSQSYKKIPCRWRSSDRPDEAGARLFVLAAHAALGRRAVPLMRLWERYEDPAMGPGFLHE